MNRLRELRKERHLSLNDLAKELNMSFSNIAMIERGERNLTSDTVKLFADFFNVSSDYLLGLSDTRQTINTTYHEQLEGIDIEILANVKMLDGDAKEDILKILKYMNMNREKGKDAKK